MTATATGRLLSPAEIAVFHAEGYVVAEDVLPARELEPVIMELGAEVDARARALHRAGRISSTFEEEGFETRLARISGETDELAKSIWASALRGPAIFHLISNANLVNIAEQLVGEEIIASSVYRLRPKLPHFAFGEVPWHQDSGYFEPYCDTSLVLTMWLPLVDATVENGCLWVMPRSHLGPVVRHRIDPSGVYLKIDPAEFPRTGRRVACPVRKGGVLLMTNRTAHASFRNESDIVRWSMDLRYQNARLPTNAGISRLEGEVVPDEARGVPLACYPPEADFLVRSTSRPHEVVTDPERFREIRDRHLAKPVTDRFQLRTKTWTNVG